jgi:hypothetical protein
LEKSYPLHLKKNKNLDPLLPRMFVPSLVAIGPVVLEKKIFKCPHPIFTFL